MRGHADACLAAIGVESTAAAVAALYADFLDGWLVDDADAGSVDLPGVRVVTGSVRAVLADQRRPAGVAVLDPPRAGAGKAVIDLVAAAGTPRVIHIGCEAAAFARDVGLYRSHGYRVEQIRVFDAFPLTHHVECAALLTR